MASTKRLTDFLNGPLLTAISRAIVIVGGATTPILIFAGTRWINERIAQAPAVITVSEVAATNQRVIGDVAQAARELTREVAALKESDRSMATDIRSAQSATADVARQVLILQTQLATQRGEDQRRMEDFGRKLDKIGDRLGVP